MYIHFLLVRIHLRNATYRHRIQSHFLFSLLFVKERILVMKWVKFPQTYK